MDRDRPPSLPVDQKQLVFRSLRFVDEVVIGDDPERGLNFESEFRRVRPDILAVTSDDRYEEAKRELCSQVGAKYVVVPKSRDWPDFSTSKLVARMRAPRKTPLRVDFAGGWLDVPALARPGAFVVNCTIQPLTDLCDPPFRQRAGLGGSAAYRILRGEDAVLSELAAGVGWQDPAVIHETGLCVWRSGPKPRLELKINPDAMLANRLALWWTGRSHDTPSVVGQARDYDRIESAGAIAARAVRNGCFEDLCEAVQLSYDAQRREGMGELPAFGEAARKYGGGGWGGYAIYVFDDKWARERFIAEHQQAMGVEPYLEHPG